MKKFVVAALLATGACLVLPSCNNGAYDSDPNSSTGGLNPLDPNSGVTVYLGTMRATLNNTITAFYPAYYTSPKENNFVVTGIRANDEVLKHTINFAITNFKNLSEFGTIFTYEFQDTTGNDSTIIYTGPVAVKLTGNEGGNLRGTFSGEIYYTAKLSNHLEEDPLAIQLPDPDKSKVIYIKDAEFYVPKKTD